MPGCGVCGKEPACHQGPSRLTPEQESDVRDFYASFDTGIHTGHLNTELMELPYRVCEEHKAPELTSDDLDAKIAFSEKKIAACDLTPADDEDWGQKYALASNRRERIYLEKLYKARAEFVSRVQHSTRFERQDPVSE